MGRNVLDEVKQISLAKLHHDKISLFAGAIGEVDDVMKRINDGAHKPLGRDVSLVRKLNARETPIKNIKYLKYIIFLVNYLDFGCRSVRYTHEFQGKRLAV